MEKQKGLHLMYKKLGETPLEAINKLKLEKKELVDVPVTYAGRLDPMAEGILILLSGEEVHNKEKYINLSKTYEAEVLWGFRTDSLDILGILDGGFTDGSVDVEDIKKHLSNSVGKTTQTYPGYSSKTVGGKQLFEIAREGELNSIEMPKRDVEIFSAKHIDRRVLSGREVLSEISRRVSLVTGDFRQKQTLDKWAVALEGLENVEFVIDKIELSVSSGFYVRKYIEDMADGIGIPAITFHIKRTRVGEFTLAQIQS